MKIEFEQQKNAMNRNQKWNVDPATKANSIKLRAHERAKKS